MGRPPRTYHRAAATALALLAAACSSPGARSDVEEGRGLLFAHGCGSCHVIPGVSGADSTVGPPLEGFARRAYVAGRLVNDAASVRRWIVDPPSVNPDTAMPDLGVSPEQARKMTAYLHTLR